MKKKMPLFFVLFIFLNSLISCESEDKEIVNNIYKDKEIETIYKDVESSFLIGIWNNPQYQREIIETTYLDHPATVDLSYKVSFIFTADKMLMKYEDYYGSVSCPDLSTTMTLKEFEESYDIKLLKNKFLSYAVDSYNNLVIIDETDYYSGLKIVGNELYYEDQKLEKQSY